MASAAIRLLKTGRGRSVSAAERPPRRQPAVRRPARRPAALLRNLPYVGDQADQASLLRRRRPASGGFLGTRTETTDPLLSFARHDDVAA